MTTDYAALIIAEIDASSSLVLVADLVDASGSIPTFVHSQNFSSAATSVFSSGKNPCVMHKLTETDWYQPLEQEMVYIVGINGYYFHEFLGPNMVIGN